METLDKYFEKEAVVAKRVAIEEVLLQQMALLDVSAPASKKSKTTTASKTTTPSKTTTTSKTDTAVVKARRLRYFRGINKLVGDGLELPRVDALQAVTFQALN
jgi:hypothetical protein